MKKFFQYKIRDLSESYEDLYCHCLEDWSSEMKEAGNRKERWYREMKSKGLGVKLAEDQDGKISGMIQYVPSQYAPLEGTDCYYIYCIWVHGHKEGLGNRQGRGMGSALLSAAEEDLRRKGAKGVAAWGLTLPFWMKASWFKKHGYKVAQKDGIRQLLWKPFHDHVEPPRWFEDRSSENLEIPRGEVVVTSLVNGVCPAMNICNERAKAVAAEFQGKVQFREILTNEPDAMKRWGITDGLFINQKEVSLGPPITKDALRKALKKALRKRA